MRFEGLLAGRLQRRYKRFLADVELDDGRVITAHWPNTGAMTGCAQPGARVWLSTSENRARKYPQTWELVETADGLACVHSALANRVAREAFVAGRVPGYEGYSSVRSEVKYGRGSRADLLLEGDGRSVYVEVKSVTLCRTGGQGVFPDAVSERGRKHIRELEAVQDASAGALLFFCVFHSGIKRVAAAGDIDPAYRDALAGAMAAGVKVMAWGNRISTRGIEPVGALPFSLDPR
jgi:sugar fermentation stimulation protein A